MKLLIVTQKVDKNDDLLGFFHGWIEEFSHQVERITVICLYKGTSDLPSNVTVLSLGKESGRSRIKYLFKFFYYIIRYASSYDHVFVHMNAEYVVLAGWLWRLMRKKVSLWYAHGHVNTYLRISEKIVHVIFSSVKEACRIESSKLFLVGQGIKTDVFVPPTKRNNHEVFKIVTVGRISAVKDYETLIDAVALLSKKGLKVEAHIIGNDGQNDQSAYYQTLRRLVSDKQLSSQIHFLGSIPNHSIISHLQNADLFVSMTHTGSLDKALLEAMSTGLPIVTCGEAFQSILQPYTQVSMFKKKDPQDFANKIEYFVRLPEHERQTISRVMREKIVTQHSLQGLIGKMTNKLSSL
jgi:glycosyltransferase involved in cell wall biosynthesis